MDRGILKSRGNKTDSKGCHRGGTVGPARIFQSNVCSPQEGRKMEASNQPETPKSICGKTTFQNGRYLRSLKDIIQEGDQMAKLDLKDAYFSVPMAQNSKRLLQFQWKSQLLQFTCLPFGLSSAPYVFTKLLRPVLTSLRDQGIHCLMYLDDMLILGKTPQELNHNFCLSKSLLTTLLLLPVLRFTIIQIFTFSQAFVSEIH